MIREQVKLLPCRIGIHSWTELKYLGMNDCPGAVWRWCIFCKKAQLWKESDINRTEVDDE